MRHLHKEHQHKRAHIQYICGIMLTVRKEKM